MGFLGNLSKLQQGLGVLPFPIFLDPAPSLWVQVSQNAE